MKVLVTGGSGFLGSHVADGLAEVGHDVTVLDVVASVRHRTAICDLSDLAGLRKSLEGMEAVCHLAAVGDVYLALNDPPRAASVNVVGTANICEAAASAGGIPLVVASTWEVYGHPVYQPIDEQHPCAPDHPYNITKLSAEQLARSYAALKGLPVTVLRLGTAFGTRMRPNSVFSVFIARALARQPIEIQGGGKQSRQFTHARDIARAFNLAIDRPERGGEVFNVVADESVSIRRLAELVTKSLPTEVVDRPARSGDVPPASISNAKARAQLGWRPTVPFEVGLAELIDAARSGHTG